METLVDNDRFMDRTGSSRQWRQEQMQDFSSMDNEPFRQQRFEGDYEGYDGEMMQDDQIAETYADRNYPQDQREFRPLKRTSREVFDDEQAVLEREDYVQWVPMRAFCCSSMFLTMVAAVAITALVLGSIALYGTQHLPPPCENGCHYCEPNGTLVMPWGGRAERPFTAIAVGVGPLFSPNNLVNYTGGKQACRLRDAAHALFESQQSHVDDDDDSHNRRKRLPGYGNDLTWRPDARAVPPVYSIGAGDAARPAALEVDGSGFVLGNMTVSCGGYVGCEVVSPVGNFTHLITLNDTSGDYFEVYPALEYAQIQNALAFVEINALNVTIQGLNSSILAANITYLTQQVNMLWVVVDNITGGEAYEDEILLNLTNTLVQLTNVTNQLSYFVYNVLPAEQCNCTYINNTLLSLQSQIDVIEIILSQVNLTGLNQTLYELNQTLVQIDAQVDYIESLLNNSGVLTNITILVQEVAILQNQVGNLTVVVQGHNVSIAELYMLVNLLNITQLSLVQNVSTLQGNVTVLAAQQALTAAQVLALNQTLVNLAINVTQLENDMQFVLVNLTALWNSQQVQDALITSLNATCMANTANIQLLNQTQQILLSNVTSLSSTVTLHTQEIIDLQGNQSMLISTVQGVQNNVSILQNLTAVQQVQIDQALQCCNTTNTTLYQWIDQSVINNASVWSQLTQVQVDLTQVNQTAVQALIGVQQLNGTVILLVNTTDVLVDDVTQLFSNVTQLEACCANNSQQLSLIIGVNQAQNQSLLDLAANVTSLNACCSNNSALIAQLLVNSTGQQEQINQLQAQVASINGTVVTLVGNNLTIFTILDNHTSQITVLQSQTTTLITQVNQLNSTVINITNTLAALNLSSLNITYINEMVNELNIAVTQIEAILANISSNNITMIIDRLNILNSTVIQMQLDIINYQLYVNSTLATLLANDALFTTQISLLQGNVTNILTQIGGIQTNISVLQSDVSALWANLTALWISQQTQDALIAGIQLNVSSLQVSVLQLQNTVVGVQSNISSLQASDAAQQLQITALQACCNATNASVVQQAAQIALLNQSLLEVQGVNQVQNQSISNILGVDQWQNDTLASLLTNASSAAACCANNSAAIILLQNSVTTVEGSVQTLNNTVVLINGVVADHNQTLAILAAVNAAQNLSISTLETNASTAAACCANNSASISLIQGVDNEQNATLSVLLINASSAAACCIATTNAISWIQGVDAVQNASIDYLLTNASAATACCTSNTAAISALNSALNALSIDYYAFKSNQTLVDLSVQTQIANLQSQILNNFLVQQACCNSTTTNIAALQAAVTVLQGDVVSLTNVNNAQNISITSIQGVDNAQNASIAALQSNATTSAACCTSNSNSITTLQGVNAAQNSSIATLQTNATTAAACCASNSANIAIVNTTSITANTTANAAQACCTSNTASIATIQGVNNAQNASIAALQASSVGIGFNVNYNVSVGLAISNSIVLPSASQTIVFNDLTCTGCFNPNSWYNTATGFATVPSTGYYSFHVSVTVAFSAASNSFFATVITSTNQVLATTFWNTVTNNAQVASSNMNGIKLLTAGTIVRVGVGAYRANSNSPTVVGAAGAAARALATQWTMMRITA